MIHETQSQEDQIQGEQKAPEGATPPGNLSDQPVDAQPIDNPPQDNGDEAAQGQEEDKAPVERFTASLIQETHVKIVVRDQQGYISAVDFIPISAIIRTTYNTVTGELFLVVPETMGRIAEGDVPIETHGKGKGGFRREIQGQIITLKVGVQGKKIIEQILRIWLKLPQSISINSVFEGFEAYEVAQNLLNEAFKKKRREDEELQKKKAEKLTQNHPTTVDAKPIPEPGKIVDMHGQPASKE